MDGKDGWLVDQSPGRGRYIIPADETEGGGAGGGGADEETADGTRTYIGGLIGIGE